MPPPANRSISPTRIDVGARQGLIVLGSEAHVVIRREGNAGVGQVIAFVAATALAAVAAGVIGDGGEFYIVCFESDVSTGIDVCAC